MNLEGEKPTRYFCSREKQKRMSTLLDSLFIENKDSKLKESFDQSAKEKELDNFMRVFMQKHQLSR